MADPRVSRTNTRWHTYDHWVETPGGASHYIPAYPGISRYILAYLGSFFLFAGTPSPDCGANVLAHADIEGPGAAGPAGVQRDADPEGAAMTLRFIVTVRDRVPVGEESPA